MTAPNTALDEEPGKPVGPALELAVAQAVGGEPDRLLAGIPLRSLGYRLMKKVSHPVAP